MTETTGGGRLQRAAFLAPRAVCIAVSAFLALFALDAVSESQGWWASVIGVAIHLVPSFVVLAVLALAWRRDLLGAGIMLALAMAYLLMAAGKVPAAGQAAIAGPLIAVAALFLMSRMLNPPRSPRG